MDVRRPQDLSDVEELVKRVEEEWSILDLRGGADVTTRDSSLGGA